MAPPLWSSDVEFSSKLGGHATHEDETSGSLELGSAVQQHVVITAGLPWEHHGLHDVPSCRKNIEKH